MKNVNSRFFNDETREGASKLHKRVWGIVRQNFSDWSFVQEAPVKIGQQTLFVDMCCNSPFKVAIEIQGRQHSEFNEFFHGTVNEFNKQCVRDKKKAEFLKDNGYAFVEFFTDERLTDVQILDRIWERIGS
jgi:very-short-patch-repair endonuclease